MKPDEGLVKCTGAQMLLKSILSFDSGGKKNKTISANVRMIDFGAAAIFRSHPSKLFFDH